MMNSLFGDQSRHMEDINSFVGTANRDEFCLHEIERFPDATKADMKKTQGEVRYWKSKRIIFRPSHRWTKDVLSEESPRLCFGFW